MCPPWRRQVFPASLATIGRASWCRPARRARSSPSSIARSSPSWRSPTSRSGWRCSASSRSRARRRNSPARPGTRSTTGPGDPGVRHQGAVTLTRGGERGEAAFEIADQVIDALEPDVDAHGRPARRPCGRGPDDGAVEGNGEALEAAPRRPNAEQRELVEERVDRLLRDRLEHDAEEPARAGEIAPPERVTGIALEI